MKLQNQCGTVRSGILKLSIFSILPSFAFSEPIFQLNLRSIVLLGTPKTLYENNLNVTSVVFT